MFKRFCSSTHIPFGASRRGTDSPAVATQQVSAGSERKMIGGNFAAIAITAIAVSGNVYHNTANKFLRTST